MDYTAITYTDAQKLLNDRFSAKNGKLPDLREMKSRRDFDADEHWQGGNGFIGQLPAGENALERTLTLQRGFSTEPIISEVLDTHVENVLGDEPQISLEHPDASEAELAQTLEILKDWYDRRKTTIVLSDALRGARREHSRVIRCFIPSGNLTGEGRIYAANLKDALDKIWFRSEPVEAGGVVVDEDTAKELGLFLYRMKIDKKDVSLCEYSYVDDASGATNWGTISNNKTGAGAEIADPFALGGHLPIYQLNVKPLIVNSVCQAQRAINLSGTMLTRNNNLAGSRERLAIGVQPPGEYVDKGTDETGATIREFVPEPMRTGPGSFNFLQAQKMFDEDGVAKALANPNLIFTDPVPIDSFVGTSEHWRSVIYSHAKMRHLLMADSATASGKSRIEARKEFQSSLNQSKEAIDPAGAWLIETALRVAAEFMGKPGKFENLRAKFGASVSTVELTPEENAQIREDYKAGLIDLQTALELRQIKNVAEVIERIRMNPTAPPPTV